MNVVLNKSKNKKNNKSIYYKFSVFLFHENRKQKIKSNMFSEFKSFENKNNFQKMKTGNENRK